MKWWIWPLPVAGQVEIDAPGLEASRWGSFWVVPQRLGLGPVLLVEVPARASARGNRELCPTLALAWEILL